jgi:hypothetical protein
MATKKVERDIKMVRTKSKTKTPTKRTKPKESKTTKIATKNTLPFEIRIFKGKESKHQYLVYKIQNSYKAFVLAYGTDAAEDIAPNLKTKKLTTNQMWDRIWRYPREIDKYAPKTQKKRKSKKK